MDKLFNALNELRVTVKCWCICCDGKEDVRRVLDPELHVEASEDAIPKADLQETSGGTH